MDFNPVNNISWQRIKTANYITTTFAYYSTSYLFNGGGGTATVTDRETDTDPDPASGGYQRHSSPTAGNATHECGGDGDRRNALEVTATESTTSAAAEERILKGGLPAHPGLKRKSCVICEYIFNFVTKQEMHFYQTSLAGLAKR